jgi:hypothetical protein
MGRHVITRHATLMRLLDRIEELYAEVEDAAVGVQGEANYRAAQRSSRRPRELWKRFHRAQGEAFAVVSHIATGYGHRKASNQEKPRRRAPWEVQLTKEDVATHGLRIFVLEVVAELEHFVCSFARWWLNSAQLARLRADQRLSIQPSLSALSATDAREQLVDLVKPTSDGTLRRKAKSKRAAGKARPRGLARTWAAKLEVVFNVRIPSAIKVALQALIKWRHEYSHRSNPPRRIDWSNGPDFVEPMITWFLSLIALSNLLVAQSRNR